MRKILLLAVILMFCAALQAQAPAHTATISWGVPVDATPAGTHHRLSRYRRLLDESGDGSGRHSGGGDSELVSSIRSTPGIYCYYVIHTENKMDSVPSTTAAAVLRPNAASGLTLTVK
jgi:hypothetical protein